MSNNKISNTVKIMSLNVTISYANSIREKRNTAIYTVTSVNVFTAV